MEEISPEISTINNPPKKNSKAKFIIIFLALLLLISSAVNFYLVFSNNSSSTDNSIQSNSVGDKSSSIQNISNWSLPKSNKKGFALSLFNGAKTPSLFIYSIDEKKLKPANIGSVESGSALGAGITDPITSPNFLYTAYKTNDGNLWILSNDTLEKKQVTENGRVIFLNGWSKDGKNFVYNVGSVTPWTEGIPNRPKEVKKLPKSDPPGFYNLNLETGKITYLFPLKSFLTFVDNERILTTESITSNSDNSGTLEVFNINTFEMDYTNTDDGFGFGVGQYDFNSNGKKWTFTYSDLIGKSLDDNTEANIILADYPNKNGIIIDKGTWAQVQRSMFSPDGNKLAYKKYYSLKDGVPQNKVMVYDISNKTSKEYVDGSLEAWISPNLILFRENEWSSNKDSKYFVLDLTDSSVTPVN